MNNCLTTSLDRRSENSRRVLGDNSGWSPTSDGLYVHGRCVTSCVHVKIAVAVESTNLMYLPLKRCLFLKYHERSSLQLTAPYRLLPGSS